MNMNIEEVAKNLKTLQLCVDINSHVFESRACMARLQKTTDEGLIAAYKLVKFSMQMKDPKLMGVVYKRAQDLFPDESKMDSVKMFEVNELKKTFERGLFELFKKHPAFFQKCTLPEMNQQIKSVQSASKKCVLEQRKNKVECELVMPNEIFMSLQANKRNRVR